MPTERVAIINMGSNQIHFTRPIMDGDRPARDAAGKPIIEEHLLGSEADRGVVGVPQPRLELDRNVWEELKKQKAIRGMLEAEPPMIAEFSI